MRALFGACGLVSLALAATPVTPTSPAPPARSGAVQTLTIPDRHKGRDRRIWVYTPPGYEADTLAGHGLVVAFDGREYVEDFKVPRMLDSLLAARRIPPLVAVLIDDSTGAERLDDLANRAWFVGFLADSLLPWVRRQWRVTADPRHVIVTGSSAGGLAAANAALQRPEVFGNVLSQSGAFWRGAEAANDPPWEWLTAQAARGPRRDVRFWLEVGTTESRGAMGGQAPSILAANRAFRDTLRAKGYAVTYMEVPNGVHGVETWGVRLPVGLAALAGASPR